jgi:hypothetical protein
VFPDARERAAIALDRVEKSSPTRAALEEMLRATLAVERSLDGARALDESGLELMNDDELRALAAQTYLDLGLCEQALAVVGDSRSEESCHIRRLRSLAAGLCDRERGPAPTCDALLLRSAVRNVFEFEGWDTELDGWEVEGQLHLPEGDPEYYVSGYSGSNFVRTDFADDGVFRATSPPFELEQAGLSVQVGGGSLEDGVVVELIVDGLALRRGAGEQDYHLRRLTWDVSELMGKRATLRIVDQGRGEWGFIFVDHLRSHPRHELDANREPR